MRIKLWKIALLSALLCVSVPAWAQQATTSHNVNLRRDPSTSSPVIEHIDKGARFTLVDVDQDSGFYHVRTEDDQVGWVWAKFVRVATSPVSTPEPAATPAMADMTCDANLSSHVYHPARLVVREDCIAVTGTIVDATNGRKSDGMRHEKDGDTHGWLQVDDQFKNLLNAGNLSNEGGNLVFEVICRFPVTQADAKASCAGFTDHVKIPPVGSHVRIVGRYVQDTFHAQWMEIHPVTNITVVQ